MTSAPVAHADVYLICEVDEQRSFVGNKKQQHWLWYAFDTKHGGVLAYTFGPRTDETCRELLAMLEPFSIGMITTDSWGSYEREVPKEKHLIKQGFRATEEAVRQFAVNNGWEPARAKELASFAKKYMD